MRYFIRLFSGKDGAMDSVYLIRGGGIDWEGRFSDPPFGDWTDYSAQSTHALMFGSMNFEEVSLEEAMTILPEEFGLERPDDWEDRVADIIYGRLRMPDPRRNASRRQP